jgi:choline monooxygenase
MDARSLDGIDLNAPPDGELLPPRAFTSPVVFDAELRAVFEKSWVHVADTPELRKAGDFVTATVGRVPLVIVRGHDGALRGFVNACRHRGATVAEGAGNCGATLRCPYHGWSYDTTGRLAGVPFREEFACLDQRDLLPVRVAQAGPLVFACADEAAPPFHEWCGELPQALDRARGDELEPAFTYSYEVAADWKVSVENALDGYHIRFVHDVLADFLALDPDRAENVLEAHSSFTRAAVSAQVEALLPSHTEPYVRFGMVFPNLIPVLTPFDFAYLRIDPVGPGRLRIVGRSFDRDAMTRDFRKEAFDRTNRQDIAVVERVQRGLQAPSLPAGVHAHRLECRIGHFERLWREAMRAAVRPLRMAG